MLVGIDTAVRINVTGPLKLLQLAHECAKMEAFVQVSSAFGQSDRTGFIEEVMYPSNGIDWQADYEKLRNMPKHAIDSSGGALLKGFPDAYVYSKRMAEEVMVKVNRK